MFRQNWLKNRLRAGKKSLGLWLAMGSPAAAEIVALAGYDFALIDLEHGPGDIENAVAQMQAMSAAPTTALVRVASNDTLYIRRALDAGAEGIMVPMVESAGEAAAAVAACRFPPRGIRGSATSLVRAADYGMREADYIEGFEDNLLILCQIETLKGIDNIEEIAGVEGVDLLFVGPSDISTAMGFATERDHPEVKAMLARVESAIKGCGKWMGTVPRYGMSPPELFALGYDMVSGGSDSGHIRKAGVAQMKAHREANDGAE